MDMLRGKETSVVEEGRGMKESAMGNRAPLDAEGQGPFTVTDQGESFQPGDRSKVLHGHR